MEVQKTLQIRTRKHNNEKEEGENYIRLYLKNSNNSRKII